MVCLDCGRPAAEFSSYCNKCRSQHWQRTAASAGFWSKFTTQSSRYTRHYNFAARPVEEPGFFSGWWPLKLLLFPFWLLWKFLQLVRS